jgi:hypothetical protein
MFFLLFFFQLSPIQTGPVILEDKIDQALVNSPNIPVGSRCLGVNLFFSRWKKIKGNVIIVKGVMPIYTDKNKAFNFWYNNKRNKVFKKKRDKKRLYDEKIPFNFFPSTKKQINVY